MKKNLNLQKHLNKIIKYNENKYNFLIIILDI